MEYNKNEAVKIMNHFGTHKKPFFFIINFEFSKAIVVPLSEMNEENILFDFESHSNKLSKKVDLTCKDILKKINKPCYKKYKKSFERIYYHLVRGDTYLLNLTFPVEIDLACSLESIFHNINAKYKIYYRDNFLVFSPETFIKISNNTIYSFPMKGTIDASIENASQILINDEKELAEHYTIVDLIRNDLSSVSKNVKVNKFRYLDYISTNKRNLLQTSSEICGMLNQEWRNNIGDILAKMLPAGSVSGAPKIKTCEIIAETEIDNRGYYTGVAGIFDGDSLDSCVLIRFIEDNKGKYIYRAGGGITTRSICLNEYEELISKVYVPIV